MAAITVTCTNPPPYRRPPRINIPNLGYIEAALNSISTIPDPADIMAKFMESLSLAMAPLKKYLQVVEALIAIKQCITAIPDAITSFSPRPIFDCLKALMRVLAVIIQDIPPIPYIQTALDLMAYSIDLIDAIWQLLSRLDAKLTRLLNLEAYAQALGDIELISFARCNMGSIGLSIQQMMDVLKVIFPVVNVIMSVLLRLIPTPAAQRAADDMLAAATSFEATQDALQGLDISVTGMPKLTGMIQATETIRNSMVVVFNIFAPIIGEAADKEQRTAPTLVHF